MDSQSTDCSFCHGPFHTSTGAEYSTSARACASCVRELWTWILKRMHGKARGGKISFYDHVNQLGEKITMTRLSMAVEALNRSIACNSEGGNLPEACSAINDASRHVIDVMFETHDEAWIGLINISSPGDVMTMRKVDEYETVHNFAADYVLPRHSKRVEALISERMKSPYISAKHDAKRIEQIQDAIKAEGGELLVWT